MQSEDERSSVESEQLEDVARRVEPQYERADAWLRGVTKHDPRDARSSISALSADESEQVYDAFRNLEADLASAGRKCIAMYDKWGNRFWNKDEAGLLNNLLRSYWYHVLTVTGMRVKYMKDQIRQGTLPLVMPISESMVTNYGDFANSDAAREPPDLVRRLKTEVGHLINTNRSIRSTTGITCDRGLQQCTTCDDLQTEADRVRCRQWNSVVDGGVERWKLMKGERAETKTLFRIYLKDPSLRNWDQLIASSVLWRFQRDFIGEGIVTNETNRFANKLLSDETARIQSELETWDPRPDDPNDFFGLPPGYYALIELMGLPQSDNRKHAYWRAINNIVGNKSVNNFDFAFIEGLPSLDDLLTTEGASSEAVIGPEVEQAINTSNEDVAAQETKKRGKRKGGKKKRAAGIEELPRQVREIVEQPQRPVDLGGAPEEGQEITWQELMTVFSRISDAFQRYRRARTAEDQERSTQNIVSAVRSNAYLTNFFQHVCELLPRAARGNAEEVSEVLEDYVRGTGQRPMEEESPPSSPPPSSGRRRQERSRAETPPMLPPRRKLPQPTAALCAERFPPDMSKDQLDLLLRICRAASTRQWVIVPFNTANWSDSGTRNLWEPAIQRSLASELDDLRGFCDTTIPDEELRARERSGIDVTPGSSFSLEDLRSGGGGWAMVDTSQSGAPRVIGFVNTRPARDALLQRGLRVVPRISLDVKPDASGQGAISYQRAPGTSDEDIATLGRDVIETSLEISHVCSNGAPGVCTLLVLYALARRIDENFLHVIVDAPTMTDRLSEYDDVLQWSNPADLASPDESIVVAQTNIVCWYRTAFAFSLAFPPQLLSLTDAKCRDLSNVRDGFIGPGGQDAWGYTAYEEGRLNQPEVLRPSIAVRRILVREYPTISELTQMLEYGERYNFIEARCAPREGGSASCAALQGERTREARPQKRAAVQQ